MTVPASSPPTPPPGAEPAAPTRGPPGGLLGLAAAAGALFALAVPPTDAVALVPLGLTALAALVARAPRARDAAALGLAFMTVAGTVGMRFVPAVVDRFTPLGFAGGVVALALLAAFQGLPWALALGVAHHARRAWHVPLPLGFALAVMAGSAAPVVFVWTPAGLFGGHPALLQAAEWIGERGLTALLALGAGLLGVPLAALLARERPGRRALVAGSAGVLLWGMLAGVGAARFRQLDGAAAAPGAVRVALINAAVDARLRWEPRARHEILERLRAQTRDAERSGVDLTVWPEAAYPHVVPHDAPALPFRRGVGVVGHGVTGPVLVGLITSVPGGQHNAAAVVERDASLQPPQAKLRLLLFGEALPLGEHLPALRQIFYRAGGLLPGREVALQRLGAHRLGVLNCYEDTLPPVARTLASAGATALVNVTNDAWFAGTLEPELHLRLSVLRAIETRLPLLRAVNLGVPAWIDTRGVVRARGAEAAANTLIAELPARAPGASPQAQNEVSPTLYVRAGDTPLVSLLLAGALAAHLWGRRRSAATGKPAP